MYDAAAKQLVWTGRAEKTLDPDSSRKDRQRSIDKAAKKMLAYFSAEVTAFCYATCLTLL